ncbi:MAG: hypothetical protein JWQ08_2545, partial [Deinococcus sp.]|nr:hypothetical protein [Deinococcus sp.]
ARITPQYNAALLFERITANPGPFRMALIRGAGLSSSREVGQSLDCR